jgi:hypothetical protein
MSQAQGKIAIINSNLNKQLNCALLLMHIIL